MDGTMTVVAHRSSTIKGLDLISMVKNGVIAEKGNHERLININNGTHASLIALNTITASLRAIQTLLSHEKRFTRGKDGMARKIGNTLGALQQKYLRIIFEGPEQLSHHGQEDCGYFPDDSFQHASYGPEMIILEEAYSDLYHQYVQKSRDLPPPVRENV
ncbi:hypothetical protein LguiA_000903 [Lonicera macranthoides]